MSSEDSVQPLASARLEMIDAAGRMCQLLGLPRSTGQIFGLLYFSPKALSLEEIAKSLSISKASASTGTRQLLGWQIIRQVWKPGERRDRFEALDDLGEVLRNGYRSIVRPKLEKADARVASIDRKLGDKGEAKQLSEEDLQFCRQRLDQIMKLQSRMKQALSIAEKLL